MNTTIDQDTDLAPSVDRAFLNLLIAHRNGSLITDVSKAVRSVVSAAQLTGKEGKVTLTLVLRPASIGDAQTLVFEPTVKATIPELKPPGSIFYADDDFNLVREDPRQRKLDLRVVSATQSQPLKTID